MGASQGVSDTPYDGGCNLSLKILSKNLIFLQPIPVNQLQTLMSIYLHWFLLKILSTSMIFREGGVVSGRVWEWGMGGPDPKNKSFDRILIHIYLQLMFMLSFQSNVLGFGTKYT